MKRSATVIHPPIEPEDAWTRWRWVWVITYYATLLVSAVGAWLDAAEEGGNQPLIIGLTVLIGLSQAGVFYLQARPEGGTRGRWWPVTTFLFAVQIAGWYGLVIDYSVFYLHLFSLFSQVNASLPRRLAWVANVVLTMGIALPQFMMFGWSWLSVLLLAVMATVSIGFGMWIDGIIRQSAERRDLLTQLQQAQTELGAAERRAGVLEERSRLARDIHDTLAQSFIGVITHLEAAGQTDPAKREKIKHHIAQAEAVARNGLQQSRRVVHELRPPVLDQNESIGEALEEIAQKWATLSGVPVTMEITGREVALPAEVEICLVRALQEALANVARHAEATAVQVTLSFIGDRVALDISDNGQGIRRKEHGSIEGGYGLQAMRERLSAHSGELFIESEPGEGVNLAIVIPI